MRRPSSPAQAVVEEAVLFSHLRNAFHLETAEVGGCVRWNSSCRFELIVFSLESATREHVPFSFRHQEREGAPGERDFDVSINPTDDGARARVRGFVGIADRFGSIWSIASDLPRQPEAAPAWSGTRAASSPADIALNVCHAPRSRASGHPAFGPS